MPDRHGPLRVARFLVEIDGVAKAGFNHCRLATSSTGVVEYREGNDPPTPRKLAGLTEYGPLELQYGVTTDGIALAKWNRLVQQGKVDEARRSVAVALLDEEETPSARWEFRDAWPARYEARDVRVYLLDAAGERAVGWRCRDAVPVRWDGPDLAADRAAAATESLELAHGGIEAITGDE